MYTTLIKIKDHSPCKGSWEKLLKSLNKTKADNRKVSIKTILKTLGVQDACWALQCVDDTPENQKNIRLMCADFAESVLPIYEKQYPNDSRVKDCIQASRDFANGKITKKQLAVAAVAAVADADDAAAADAAAAAAAAYAAAAAAAADAAAVAAVAAAADADEKEKQRVIMLKYI